MSETNGYMRPEELFQPQKRAFRDVEVELGKFRIRQLNAREAAELDAIKIGEDGKLKRSALVSHNARVVVASCVDGEGNLIFTKDHVHQLLELPAAKLSELADECENFSGTKEADEAAKN